MTHHVAVPCWLLLIVAALALWAFVEHFLTPSLRWFFRRRVNVVIQEINTRLNIEISSFKLTRREVVIDRLFHDPAVQQAAQIWRKESNSSEAEAKRKVDREPIGGVAESEHQAQ